ncbi:MAG TPA: DUF1800 domain-containing protein [Acetobacteraceae bacterium]
MDITTAQALVRFGLGRRGSEPVPTDPHAWLRAQIRQPDPAADQPVPDLGAAMQGLRADRQNRMFGAESAGHGNFRRDALAMLSWSLVTPAPFRERLVWFWSNHFTVSSRRPQCEGLIGPFVANAIRPHVTGRFEDMLLAVIRHPAMLIYLDNANSVGPQSPAGRNGKRGLNENLARECMELHTLSPAAGYTQADVTNFARILTGWSIDFDGGSYGFRFRPAAHEPGPITLMGRTFPPGEAGGVEALSFLANHPATHHELAAKLARHFIADAPADGDVRQIEGVLRDTRGDLGAAAELLIGMESAWRPDAKLRSPLDFTVATLRALNPPSITPQALGALGLLGQPLWSAPQPNGWPDRAADWATPEGMLRRIDFAYSIAGRAGGQADPVALADATLGPLLRPATQDAIRRAGSRRDAVALLLASPEFQRR